MASAKVLPPANSTSITPAHGEIPAPVITNWTNMAPQYAPHEQAAEIVRQVDYYFSEENMASDEYLLGFTGLEGTNPVNIGLIMSFRKMKQYKPKTAVREALRQSEVVEVVDSTRIRRRKPLTCRILVTPKVDVNRYRKLLSKEQPHLKKNMLKPTGFEENAAEGPISPAQYEKDQEIYNPDDSILTRLENAVAVFDANRKMHQDTRAIFTSLMSFSGFVSNASQFQGGVEEERKRLKEEGWDKEDIAIKTAPFSLFEPIKDAVYGEIEGQGDSNWVVDFEGVAKAYLSTVFMERFVWYDAKIVATAVQVLRNFYGFLMMHNVCPEYDDQLIAARELCTVAAEELNKLATVDQSLPGAFNSACSTLCDGTYAEACRSTEAEWGQGKDNMGLSRDQAKIIFTAGVGNHGTKEQYDHFVPALNGGAGLKCIASQKVGLEITGFEVPSEDVKAQYDKMRELEGYDEFLFAMGKLICKPWKATGPPEDLPAYLTKRGTDRSYAFLVEEETLKYCVPGMKMEALVCTLGTGLKYIDSIEKVWPSFYTSISNEHVLEWKAPGPPKAWMKRQTMKKKGIEEEVPAEDGEAEGADFSDEEKG